MAKLGVGVIRRVFFLILMVGCALTLSACGFHLRGEQNYAFKRLAIVGAPAPVAARLTRIIEGGSDTVVVASPQDADAVLHVSESHGWETETMDVYGNISEYQIDYRLSYSLSTPSGTVLLAPSQIALNRAMTYSVQYSTAKASESDLLFADMQNDAVDQITRRLAFVHTLHPKPGEVVPGVAPRAPLPPPPL